jgi:hypothetical protein
MNNESSENNSTNNSINNNKSLEEKNTEEKNQLLYELLLNTYDENLARRRNLDDKAHSLIDKVSITAGLLIGLGVFQREFFSLNFLQQIFYFGGLFSLIITIILSLKVVKATKYNRYTKLEIIERYFKDPFIEKPTVIIEIIKSLLHSIETIDQNNIKKGKYLILSWHFLVMGISLLLVYLILAYLIPFS